MPRGINSLSCAFDAQVKSILVVLQRKRSFKNTHAFHAKERHHYRYDFEAIHCLHCYHGIWFNKSFECPLLRSIIIVFLTRIKVVAFFCNAFQWCWYFCNACISSKWTCLPQKKCRCSKNTIFVPANSTNELFCHTSFYKS